MKNKINISKLPISAVMVIYNEERLLEKALSSIYDLVDEIIIIHDGKCTDNSLTIAKRFTNKIFVLTHNGFCDSHRVFGIKKAKNDWVFLLDADEYLSTGLRERLSSLLKNEVDIYQFLWPTHHKDKLYNCSYKASLFKKGKIYCIGAIHEYPKPINNKVITVKTDLTLMHQPLKDNYSIEVFRKKSIPLAKLQAKQLIGDFCMIKRWNYTKKEWDFPNNLRIKYPFLLGMIITPIFHMFQATKSFFKTRKTFFLRQGVMMSIYFVFLYYNVSVAKIKIYKSLNR